MRRASERLWVSASASTGVGLRVASARRCVPHTHIMIVRDFLCVLGIVVVRGLNNGMYWESPPQGWRSWNAYGFDVTQEKIVQAAAAVARERRQSDGSMMSLAQLGYANIGLDDNWQACGAGVSRSFHDAAGRPIVNQKLFPDMAAMVKQIHSLKLKAGWYLNVSGSAIESKPSVRLPACACLHLCLVSLSENRIVNARKQPPQLTAMTQSSEETWTRLWNMVSILSNWMVAGGT